LAEVVARSGAVAPLSILAVVLTVVILVQVANVSDSIGEMKANMTILTSKVSVSVFA
jgi:hypothetical protein